MAWEEVNEALKKTEGFDWNKGNVNKNWLRHQVATKECEEVLFNQPLLVSPDRKHSTKKEKRFHALGKTDQERKLFIAFTIRENKIRVISARDQNKRERSAYAKATADKKKI